MNDKTTDHDFEKAFKAIDPRALLSFLRVDGFGEWLRGQDWHQLDPGSIMKLQQGRLQALAKANEAALGFYRLQLERQAQLFDEVVRATWAKSEQGNNSEEATGLKDERIAMETAFKLMQRYSEETAAAAQQAFEKVSAEFKASLKSSPKT